MEPGRDVLDGRRDDGVVVARGPRTNYRDGSRVTVIASQKKPPASS